MIKSALLAFLLLLIAVPMFAGAHKSEYQVPCTQLWDAVQDTINNSGHYTVVVSDPNQMTASYHISGAIHARDNSVHLEPQGTGCQMQVSSGFSGVMQNDAGDFKSRVDQSLERLQATKPPATAKPEVPHK